MEWECSRLALRKTKQAKWKKEQSRDDLGMLILFLDNHETINAEKRSFH